jgi:hypothetical protein
MQALRKILFRLQKLPFPSTKELVFPSLGAIIDGVFCLTSDTSPSIFQHNSASNQAYSWNEFVWVDEKNSLIQARLRINPSHLLDC